LCSEYSSPFYIGAQESPLQIITKDWTPYNYKEECILKGFSVEIVQAILDDLGDFREVRSDPSKSDWYFMFRTIIVLRDASLSNFCVCRNVDLIIRCNKSNS